MAAFSSAPIASAHRRGKILVVPRACSLPANCIKCGAPAQTPWRKKFYWHHPLLYLMILFPGLLIYAIVALFVRKSMELNVPLCQNHHEEKKRNNIVGAILILGCVPAGILASTALDLEAWVGWIVGFAMFIAGAVFLSIAGSFMRPQKIDESGGEFMGASEDFLRLLPGQ